MSRRQMSFARWLEGTDDSCLEPGVLTPHHLLRDAIQCRVVLPVKLVEQPVDALARGAAEEIGKGGGVAVP